MVLQPDELTTVLSPLQGLCSGSQVILQEPQNLRLWMAGSASMARSTSRRSARARERRRRRRRGFSERILGFVEARGIPRVILDKVLEVCLRQVGSSGARAPAWEDREFYSF